MLLNVHTKGHEVNCCVIFTQACFLYFVSHFFCLLYSAAIILQLCVAGAKVFEFNIIVVSVYFVSCCYIDDIHSYFKDSCMLQKCILFNFSS